MGIKWKNIITFGAQGRVDKQYKNYSGILKELNDNNLEMERKRRVVNLKLTEVVEIKKDAVITMNRITKLTKHLKVKDRQIIQNTIKDRNEKIEFKEIEQILTVANSALSASKGIGAGLAASSSATFLIGSFGTASTGTAISSLSGAAATNATLAWLGGGSIASGGGGMAAGTVVAGGIIIIPALAVMAFLNHFSANKEIKLIKEKELEAYKIIDKIKKNILAIELIDKRSQEVSRSLLKTKEVFIHQFKHTYREVYKVPFISRLIKFFRKLFGKNYYNEIDLINISHIGKIASDYAKLIDTEIIK